MDIRNGEASARGEMGVERRWAGASALPAARACEGAGGERAARCPSRRAWAGRRERDVFERPSRRRRPVVGPRRGHVTRGAGRGQGRRGRGREGGRASGGTSPSAPRSRRGRRRPRGVAAPPNRPGAAHPSGRGVPRPPEGRGGRRRRTAKMAAGSARPASPARRVGGQGRRGGGGEEGRGGARGGEGGCRAGGADMAAHSKPLSARPHTCARASAAAPRWLTFPERARLATSVGQALTARRPPPAAPPAPVTPARDYVPCDASSSRPHLG